MPPLATPWLRACSKTCKLYDKTIKQSKHPPTPHTHAFPHAQVITMQLISQYFNLYAANLATCDAPLTNLSVFVDICQPFILLQFCRKIQIKNVWFCGFTLLTAAEEKCPSLWFLSFSNAVVETSIRFCAHTIYYVRKKPPFI